MVHGLKIDSYISMKNLFAVLIFPLVLSTLNKLSRVNVNNFEAAIEIQDGATLEGRWVLMPVMASDTAAGKIPYLNFDLKTGKFFGNTGCNNISGTFLLSQNALQFNEKLISTRMACPGYNEDIFVDNLFKTNRYEIRGGVLQLMYNTTILSKWVRHNDTNPTKQI